MEAIELQNSEAIRQHREWKKARNKLNAKPAPAPRFYSAPQLTAPPSDNVVIPPKPIPVKRIPLHSYKSTRFFQIEAHSHAWHIGNETEIKMPMVLGVRRTYNFVLRMMAEANGVSKSEIVGSRRFKEVALARFVSMYILRDLFELSYPALGDLFNRDHTSALAAVRIINERCVRDKYFAQHIAMFIELVRRGREKGYSVLDQIPVGNRSWGDCRPVRSRYRNRSLESSAPR